MKNPSFWILAGMVFCCRVSAQDGLRGALIMGFQDVAQIKQRAEAGDPNAQVTLGHALASKFYATEALQWFRKAAAQGHVEGTFQVGQMLLFGAPGIPTDLRVQPNPAEGLRWTFMAATNYHPNACRNMAKALTQGLGTSKDLVAAYAWLKLFTETKRGATVGRVEMNQLALALDSASLRQAETLAARFKAGFWQAPGMRLLPDGDARLKLSGITFGGKRSLAIINGRTLSEGERATIVLKSATLSIECLRIEKDAVMVRVDGEDSRRLRLQ